jgi:hypothetical protein
MEPEKKDGMKMVFKLVDDAGGKLSNSMKQSASSEANSS